MGNPNGKSMYYRGRPVKVAASQTDAALGTGVGDYISHILVVPATTSPGAITISDGATDYLVFTGGTNSVSNLVPFIIPLGWVSQAAGWTVDTGANVQIHAVGDFN